MPTFVCYISWTEQGIRSVKEAPKRGKTARELARKLGVEMKHLYLTSGDSDLLCIMEAPSADNIAKFAMAISSLGNVRTRTAMAWSETEYEKLVSGTSVVNVPKYKSHTPSFRGEAGTAESPESSNP